ncbi:MAG: O-antigen ligase family protein [Planctomycetota bacterium]
MAAVAGGLALEVLSQRDSALSMALSLGTKTGDISELTSATGRTEIWAEAIRLIGERPWTGYGLNSAPLFMADYSAHTHNLLLHVTFSAGVFAGMIAIVLLLWNLFRGLRSNEPLIRVVSVFVLISGVFEDTVLETFPISSTILWLVVLMTPSLSAATLRSSAADADSLGHTGPIGSSVSAVYT